jgi:plastocyanin
MTSAKRLIALIAALGALSATPAGAQAAATITVEPTPNSNTYAPVRVTKSLDEAQFTWIWGPNGAGAVAPHDVMQDAGLFDSGTAVTEGRYELTASAGTFPYFCSIHFGMEARIAVRPVAAGGYPDPFGVAWASDATETGRKFDVRFKVGKGRWQMWRNDTTGFKAIFGRGGRPVDVDAGKTYAFQARSVRTKRKLSDWSPALKVGGSVNPIG